MSELSEMKLPIHTGLLTCIEMQTSQGHNFAIKVIETCSKVLQTADRCVYLNRLLNTIKLSTIAFVLQIDDTVLCCHHSNQWHVSDMNYIILKYYLIFQLILLNILRA